jgi:hypothetical protein
MQLERRRKGRESGEMTGGRLGVLASSLDHEKYVYRWINDAPGRIHGKTQEDDWDVVMKTGVKEDSADLGNAVSEIVGSKPDGSPLRAYLCRKPRKFYDEDQAEKNRDLDRQLADMKRGRDRSGASQADYVPHSGISM